MKYCYSLVLFGILLLLQSCIFGDDINIEDNDRIFVSGNVTDDSGVPISNLLVRSLADDFTLGESVTDDSGLFEFTSLNSNKVFKVAFNTVNGFDAINNNLSTVTYQFVQVQNNTVRIRDVVLRSPATLNFSIIKTNPNSERLSWRLILKSLNCNLRFGGDSNEQMTTCNQVDEDSGSQSSADENFEQTYTTVLSSEAELLYMIDDNPIQSIIFTINTENFDYTFQY